MNSTEKDVVHIKSISKYKISWKAYFILFAGLAITILLSLQSYRYTHKMAVEEFTTVCNEIEHKITARLHAHALVLRAGAAYFSVSDTVTRNEWKIFIERSKIDKNLPGILGVGFSLIIPAGQLNNHISRIRMEGFPDYTIYPAGPRDTYTSIIYLEPFSGRNLRAFGYDMFSEPVRRTAMEISRDQDVAMLSGRVSLVQETTHDIQYGTLMYVPFYNPGKPVNSVEQRREAILGWVYSPYRMNDLMQGILGHWEKNSQNKIRLKVFDDSLSGASLLYDSFRDQSPADTQNVRSLTLPIVFNEKSWVLYFTQSQDHILFFTGRVVIVFISGIIISFLLFLLTISYINTLQRSQQIRNQNEELRLLNKQKDKFFSIIAHDLKSPFNSIVGFSELLVERVSAEDYHGILKFADIIRQSSERAMELLMNLMEWARSQTGKLEFNMEYFDLISLVNELLLFYKDIAGQKLIDISTSMPPNATVFADKAMINTVLRNLISNAIKFTYPQGKINILISENADKIMVSVVDNGVGISSVSIGKIFSIDENHSTNGTNNEKGTGLGLILCREFIDKHGGNIWVESEVGKGSSFNFTLSK